ncbi:MAG TPA: porin [Vicinamibacterales bacterium]
MSRVGVSAGGWQVICAFLLVLAVAVPLRAQQASPPPITAGPVTISGYLQADAIVADDPEEQTSLETPDTFRIRRARVGLSGKLTPKLQWKVQAELANLSNGARVLRDAYLSYEAHDAVAVQAGQFVAPFSLERLTSTSRLEVIDRSVIGDDLSPSRDMGVMLFNPKPFFGWLSYHAAVINGTGQNQTDDNDAKDFVGRVSVAVPQVKGLTLAVNGTRGGQPEGLRTRAGFDASFERPAYRLAFETVRQRLDYARFRETDGFLILGVYRHKARNPSPHYAGCELAVRYVHVDDDGYTLTTDTLQFGGNYYLTPQVRVMSNLAVPVSEDQPRNQLRWWSRVQVVF